MCFFFDLFWTFFIFLIFCFFFKSEKFISLFGVFFNILIFFKSILFWLFFDKSIFNFQFLNRFECFLFYDFDIITGIDGFSLFFILLSSLILPICYIFNWNDFNFFKSFIVCFLILGFLILSSFLVLDFFLFFIFFEMILIPMFFIIGYWGSRLRKIKAAYYFFFFTFFGSFFILFGLFIIFCEIGNLNFFLFLEHQFFLKKQCLLWFCFFCGFAIKIPVYPLHLWLLEAHVEAPTVGSIILASLLLKLGGYGFLRFVIPIFIFANKFFIPFVFMLSCIGVLYASFSAIRQIDIKRVIAYSSIAHMNLAVLGLFSNSLNAFIGSVFLLFAHGITSAGLFFLVGVLYQRYRTKLIWYFSGLVQIMPLFTTVFCLFSLSNISLPLSFNFIGEFLVLLGLFEVNFLICVLSTLSMVLSVGYSFWLFNKIVFCSVKFFYLNKYQDLTKKDFFLILPLLFLNCFFGIFSNNLINNLFVSCKYIIFLNC